MGKAIGISIALHVTAILLMAFWNQLFRGPMQPPTRVFRVNLVAASELPQAEEAATKTIEKSPMPGLPSRKTPPKKVEPAPPKGRTMEQKTIQTRKGLGNLTIEGGEFDNPLYINTIFQKISMNWRNPLPKGGRLIQCTVYFKIQRNGVFSDVDIKQRSGNPLFDQSCLAAVKASSPLPPIPEEFTGDFIGINFEFQHQP